jgi:TRAP-type C4-dicarboxylate transport system substrate-binding protein
VQKHCSLTGHTWDGHFIFGNARKLQALPKEVQDALAKHLNAAALKQREDIARLNKDAEAQLAKAGIVFHRPNTAPFRELLRSAGFYKEWKGKFGDEAWAKLEKYAGTLA